MRSHRAMSLDDAEQWLFIGCSEGNIGLVETCIEKGLSFNFHFKSGDTPLGMAIKAGYPEIVALLLEKGADVDATNKEGSTAMHLASQVGKLEVLELLIEKGVAVNATDKDKDTPLHMAIWSKQPEAARLLIEKGADTNAINKNGHLPLHLAILGGLAEIVRLLLTDVNAEDKYGDTLLHTAIRKGHSEVAKLLIEKGANVTAVNKYGKTPLSMAIKKNLPEVVEMIILKHSVTVLEGALTAYKLKLSDFAKHPIMHKLLENAKKILKARKKKITRKSFDPTSIWQRILNRFRKLPVLYSFPKMWLQVESLTTLDLSNNRLSHVPYQIDELKNLEKLKLCNNKLFTLPVEKIRSIYTLKILDVRGNASLVRFIPKYMVKKRDPWPILEFLAKFRTLKWKSFSKIRLGLFN